MSNKVEYPKDSGVSIRPIANITGGESYGQGWLVTLPKKLTGNGRERKQFKTLQAAKEFAVQSVAGVREIGGKFIDLEHSDRDASLRLLEAIKERDPDKPQDIVDDVIAALKAIGASPLRLTECVTFALPRLAPTKVVTVLEAADHLKESMTDVSKQYRRTFGVQLDRITETLGAMPVSHLDGVKINEFISGLRLRPTKDKDGNTVPGKPASPKFRKHILGAMRQLVRHSIANGWLTKGVVDFDIVKQPKQRKRGAIQIFTPEELAKLLKHADEDLVPFLAIGAFAGLRAAEIERLEWQHINLVHRSIEVVGGYSEVTEGETKAVRRLAPITPNLKAWLAPIRKKSGRVFAISTAGGNLTERLSALAKKAGLTGWRKNAPRHSFCSHRTMATGDINRTALESGNTAEVIRTNYFKVVSKAQAKRFFAIMPTAPENVAEMPEAAVV